MKKSFAIILSAALMGTSVPMAMADPPAWAKAHGKRAKERAVYDQNGRYYEPRTVDRGDNMWRGRDGRYYCKRDNGTTGLIIGAGVGALAGRAIDGGRDRTLGTILGAVGGGLLGREIDRGSLKCR